MWYMNKNIKLIEKKRNIKKKKRKCRNAKHFPEQSGHLREQQGRGLATLCPGGEIKLGCQRDRDGWLTRPRVTTRKGRFTYRPPPPQTLTRIMCTCHVLTGATQRWPIRLILSHLSLIWDPEALLCYSRTSDPAEPLVQQSYCVTAEPLIQQSYCVTAEPLISPTVLQQNLW